MKKVVIFTSRGGGGHLSVSNALEQQLKGEYDVRQVFIFSDVLGTIDPINLISRGRYNGEILYNWFMRKRIYWVLNAMASLGSVIYSLFAPRVELKLNAFFQAEQPDLVISAIPLVNSSILAVTKQRNLPFIVIPTDLDATTFINGFKGDNYKNLYFTLPFDNELIKQSIEAANIPSHNVCVTGFVLRPDFFELKDIARIKKDLNVPEGKPVIMLMMGAVGSDVAYHFTQELSKMKQPAHLLVCTGRNEKLRKKIATLPLPDHISMTLIGFTQKIAELMAVSDLFITKSGTVSFCEGMYMNIPMLLDATSTVLEWEKLNHQLAKDHDFGTSVKSHEQVRHVVESLIADPQRLAAMRANLESMHKKRGCQEIKKLIKEIL